MIPKISSKLIDRKYHFWPPKSVYIEEIGVYIDCKNSCKNLNFNATANYKCILETSDCSLSEYKVQKCILPKNRFQRVSEIIIQLKKVTNTAKKKLDNVLRILICL